MYVGLKLFGFLGFILGPVGLLLIRDLVEEYDRNAVQAAGGGGGKERAGKAGDGAEGTGKAGTGAE